MRRPVIVSDTPIGGVHALVDLFVIDGDHHKYSTDQDEPPGGNPAWAEGDGGDGGGEQAQPKTQIAHQAERSGSGLFQGFEMGQAGAIGLARVQTLSLATGSVHVSEQGMLGFMLARLRRDLDMMPSPVEDRPGLLMRDPFHYSDATLIVPPQLLPCLEFFDGEKSELDLRAFLVQNSGQLDVGGLVDHLQKTLSEAGFLEDEAYAQLKEEKHRAFAAAPVREPVHAGSGYPDDPGELSTTFADYMRGADRPQENGRVVRGIAAPHVSPFGGVETYRAAYSALSREDADKTFVILGTSHYGQPDRFGLTRKPFVTPLGETLTDLGWWNGWNARRRGRSWKTTAMRWNTRSNFRWYFCSIYSDLGSSVVPVLCGSYARSMYLGGKPEDNDDVRRALGALGDIAR